MVKGEAMRKLNNIKFKINDIPFNILNLYSLDKELVLDTVAFINPENNLYFYNNYGFLDSFQNSENCTQEDIYDFFENVFVFNKLPVGKVKLDGMNVKSKFLYGTYIPEKSSNFELAKYFIDTYKEILDEKTPFFYMKIFITVRDLDYHNFETAELFISESQKFDINIQDITLDNKSFETINLCKPNISLEIEKTFDSNKKVLQLKFDCKKPSDKNYIKVPVMIYSGKKFIKCLCIDVNSISREILYNTEFGNIKIIVLGSIYKFNAQKIKVDFLKQVAFFE